MDYRDQTKPKRIGGTRIFVAGTQVNLADPKTIEWLKASKITKVFCLFPIKPGQFGDLKKEVREVFPTMEKLYKAWQIDPMFTVELSKVGIQTSPLIRNPEHLREYDSFVKEAISTKHNFLIQCYAGLHASSAYAMYYLAKATPMTLEEIREAFIRSGRGKDLGRIEDFLKAAKVYVGRVVERKLAQMRIATQIKALQKARKAEKKRKRKRPNFRRN